MTAPSPCRSTASLSYYSIPNTTHSTPCTPPWHPPQPRWNGRGETFFFLGHTLLLYHTWCEIFYSHRVSAQVKCHVLIVYVQTQCVSVLSYFMHFPTHCNPHFSGLPPPLSTWISWLKVSYSSDTFVSKLVVQIFFSVLIIVHTDSQSPEELKLHHTLLSVIYHSLVITQCLSNISNIQVPSLL